MITAAQARQNAFASEQQLEQWLKKMEPKIVEASTRGDRSTYFFHDDIVQGVTDSRHPYWVRIRAALKNLGYSVSDGEVPVGGGLAGLPDPDDQQMAPVVRVSW